MNPPQPARKASSIKRSYSASTICGKRGRTAINRSEEHTSELQSQSNLVCRLLLEKKKNKHKQITCNLKFYFLIAQYLIFIDVLYTHCHIVRDIFSSLLPSVSLCPMVVLSCAISNE